ncbi:MAG: hypothetical protein MK105_02465 [Crocinitomicaceae bacterium]|nr:hypothetical protein [Crocinitomicaceae bacterium]
MNQKIKKIERLLKVKLAPHQYGKREENAYSLHQDKVNELYLNNLDIDTFADIKEIYGLTIKNATVSSLSTLLQVNIYRLTLENVVFKNTEDSIITNDTLRNITYTNTNFNAKHLSNCTDLKFVFFHDCKIENLYEICSLPKLYQLHFDNVTLAKLEKSKFPPAPRHWSLDISNMQFNDIEMWLPFANIKYLRLHNCHIKSISNLYCFKKLEAFDIDSDCVIENTELTNHKHQHIRCEITQGKQPINLQHLFPIANYINQISFCDFKEKQLQHIEKFKYLNTLVFDKSTMHLDAFLPIASQIKTINIQDSYFKPTQNLKQFTCLSTFETNAMDDLGLTSLKELLPIKHQLKTFISFDECEDLESISEFSKLEFLQINGIELCAATQILKLSSLKHLYFYVNLNEEEENKHQERPILSLENLTNLERLNVTDSDVDHTGFEHLKQLKALRIDCGVDELNSFPKMERLERLNIEGEGNIIISLERFPNLKELKVGGTNVTLTINLPLLEILEILYVTEVTYLSKMPQLKKLRLPQTTDVAAIFKLTHNLRYLHFEDFEQENLEFLKPLQQLEYLNLDGKVADISTLNSLNNLKEVNLSGLEHLESQLENAEHAVYYPGFRLRFHVYEEDDLWI